MLSVPCTGDLFILRFVSCGDLFRDRSPQQCLLSKMSGPSAAKRHLITLLNTLPLVNARPGQVVMGAVLSASKATREKPESTLWKVFSSALTLKLCCLSPSMGTSWAIAVAQGTTCTQAPNQARDAWILFQGPAFSTVVSQASLLLYSCQTFW